MTQGRTGEEWEGMLIDRQAASQDRWFNELDVVVVVVVFSFFLLEYP